MGICRSALRRPARRASNEMQASCQTTAAHTPSRKASGDNFLDSIGPHWPGSNSLFVPRIAIEETVDGRPVATDSSTAIHSGGADSGIRREPTTAAREGRSVSSGTASIDDGAVEMQVRGIARIELTTLSALSGERGWTSAARLGRAIVSSHSRADLPADDQGAE